MVYGKAHVRGIIESLSKIQRSLFPADGEHAEGSFVGAVAKMLEAKFGINTSDVPMGWYLWPNSAGGLDVKDFFVELFAILTIATRLLKTSSSTLYGKTNGTTRSAMSTWNKSSLQRYSPLSNVSLKEPFMPFEEFIKAREERGRGWYDAYMKLLKRPTKVVTSSTPQIDASIRVLGEGLKAFGGSSMSWSTLSSYWQWVIGVHHDAMVHKFGSLAVVEAGSIPVGIVDVFKGSRMRWEQ